MLSRALHRASLLRPASLSQACPLLRAAAQSGLPARRAIAIRPSRITGVSREHSTVTSATVAAGAGAGLVTPTANMGTSTSPAAAVASGGEVPWYLSAEELDINFVEYPTPRTGGPLKAPVIFMHGLLGNQANFRTFTRDPCLTDRRVLCLDARNHGQSPRSDDLSFSALARDVSRVISTQLKDSPPPLLVGHSLGGKVAMATALLGRVPLHSLLVLDIAPVTYPMDGSAVTSSSNILRAMDSCNLSASAAPTRASVDSQLAPLLPDERVRQFVLTNLVPNNPPLPLVAPNKGSVVALSNGTVLSSPSRESDVALKAASRAPGGAPAPDGAFVHTKRRPAQQRRPRMTVVHPTTGEVREIVGEIGREDELQRVEVDWDAPYTPPDSIPSGPDGYGSEFEDDADYAVPATLPLAEDIDAPPQDQPWRWRASVRRLLKGYDTIRGFDLPWTAPAGLPVTFVRAENSSYFTADHARAPGIRDMFPSSRVVTYPTKSHWVHAECPAILRWHIAALLEPSEAVGHFGKMEKAGVVFGVHDP